jgi:hypothetical protein
MSKVQSQHTSNNLFQTVTLSRKKTKLLWLVMIITILGLVLVPWLFNSNSWPLDIGNTLIKQSTDRSNYKNLEKIGESFHVVSPIELLMIYKQDHNFFFKRCAQLGLDKKECEDIRTILIQINELDEYFNTMSTIINRSD